MKTKMKIFSWVLSLVLALGAVGSMAQNNQSLTQTVCPGDEPYRVLETLPGTVYNWYITGGTAGEDWQITGNGNDSITVSWNTVGTYTLSIFTSLNGCNGDTNHVQVTVALPLLVTIVPDNPSPICAGGTIEFTANVTNGSSATTYQWYVNGAAVEGATASTYTYTGIAPGADIYCEVSDPNACGQTGLNTPVQSNVVSVVVNEQITLAVSISATNDSICINESVVFTATVESGGTPVTYQWYNGSTQISGATSNTYIYTGNVVGSENIYCEVSSTDPCVVGTPVNSNVITIVTKPRPTTSLIFHN